MRRVFVLVHPAVACFEAESMIGPTEASRAREAIIRDLTGVGPEDLLLHVTGNNDDDTVRFQAFNDAIAAAKMMSRNYVVSDGCPYGSLGGNAPEKGAVAGLGRLNVKPEEAEIFVTGAFYFTGNDGWVGAVAEAIRKEGFSVRVLGSAVLDPDSPVRTDDDATLVFEQRHKPEPEPKRDFLYGYRIL